MLFAKAHALFSRRALLAAAPVALGAILSAVVPAGAAPASKTAHASTSHSTASHASSIPAYKPPPLAPGDTLLARVGDRNITLESFRQEWAQLDPDQRAKVPDLFIAYKSFLSDIVTRELMTSEATRHPRPLTPQQEKDLDSLWHLQARNQLFIEEVDRRVTVDPTQIARYRKELGHILYLNAFLLPSQDAAQAWYTRIVGGTPISKLEAAAKAGGPGAPQEFDLGHKIREDFDEATAKVLFALAPGRLSPPVKTAQGWALIQLVGSRLRPNNYANGSDAGVLTEMHRIKVNSYKEVYRDSLAHALHIVYHEEAMDTLVNRFLQLPARTSPSESGTMSYHMYEPMPAFRPVDANLVLATTDEGKVTGADLYRFLLNLGDIARPEIRSRSDLRPWVDRVAFDNALLRRALAQGYDKKPRVLKEMAKAREFDLVTNLYQDSVASTVRLSDREVRAFYDSDPSRWKLDETVSAWVCAVPRRVTADSLIAAGKAGANLKEIAYKFTMLSDFAENGGMTQPFTRSTCPIPAATDKVFSTPVGSYGGPIASPEGWEIFKVLAKTPARQRSFTEVHDDAARAVRNDREEVAMQLFLGRLHKRIPVVVHQELLAKLAGVKLPVKS